MDTKEHSLVKFYYEKLVNNTFDEKDVYAFLSLLKNRCKGNRCITELTDLVMHREQHNGFIKEYLFQTREKFISIGKTKAAIRIEDVFSFKEIRNGINLVLAEYQLPALANDEINHFVTCLISILQQIMITEKDRETGKLFFAISKKQVILMAEIEVSQNFLKKTTAVFPVLTANNSYIDLKKQDKFDTPYLFTDKEIEITGQTGKLGITIPE